MKDSSDQTKRSIVYNVVFCNLVSKLNVFVVIEHNLENFDYKHASVFDLFDVASRRIVIIF